MPVIVGLVAPVDAQEKHQGHHQDPENLSEDSLVGEEDVDEALDGRVLGVVDDDLIAGVEPLLLLLRFRWWPLC